MTSQLEIQLGKKGITKEFIEDIKKRTEKYRNINLKITILRSARKDKRDVEQYAKELKQKLGSKFTYKILGFSIFLRKWRKSRGQLK